MRLFSGQRNRIESLKFVTEQADWSIKWDGINIIRNLDSSIPLAFDITTSTKGIRNSIIHFGSRNTYLPKKYKSVHRSNFVGFTWFHGTPDDTEFINSLAKGSKHADFIHTSCKASYNQLIEWGAEEQKIHIIPIGVDLEIFKPKSKEWIKKKKEELGIPEDAVLIGSFQKDGNGWGEGLSPKLIKGPDTFCEVVEQLNKKWPLHILLTGPARGYVKNRLEKAGIPYTHIYLSNYPDIVNYYPLLDLYIIGSRAEGGPKALVEAMASGVPLVSTKVGMAPEIIDHGKNGFLTELEDTEELIDYASQIINSLDLRKSFRQSGMHVIQSYDYKVIAREYYEKLYKPLLI